MQTVQVLDGPAAYLKCVIPQQRGSVTTFINELWNTAVRAGPVVMGIVLFAMINGLRRWFNVQYTPSYFVVFPISLLDKDVARFAGTGPFGPVENDEDRRRLKRHFIAKAAISAVVTFAVIPLALGVAAALYMQPAEFFVMLIAVLVWQGYASYQSTTDNSRYSEKPISSARLFALFYAFYLASLGGFMHRGFAFALPFSQTGNWRGLVGAAWDVIFVVLIAGAVLTVLSAVLSHFVVDREVV